MCAFMFTRTHVSLTFIITSKSDEKEHVPKQRHLRQQLYMLEYVFCVDKNKINIIYSRRIQRRYYWFMRLELTSHCVPRMYARYPTVFSVLSLFIDCLAILSVPLIPQSRMTVRLMNIE
jgi:hypothetical protein